MPHPSFTGTPAAAEDLVQARQALARAVRRVLGHRNGATEQAPRVRQVQVPLPPLDPFRWLQAQTLFPRVYWSGRHDAEARCGVGAAHLLAADADADVDALQRLLAPVLAGSEAPVRYLGGLRFDAARPTAPRWRPFGTYRFVLPRFELHGAGEDARLVCNLLLPFDYERADAILAELDALVLEEGPPRGSLSLPTARDDRPGLEGWRDNIRWALHAFASSTLEKVVLARRALFHLEAPIDPYLLLSNLQPATPNCFHFCFQFEPGAAFLGASPERLFHRAGRQIRSEAVAGTRPRGASDLDDARLRDELLRSEKDQREHAYVRDSIERALAPLCEHLHVDARASVMRLARGRHLVSGVHGTLHPGATDFEVLRRLHPTPAVGGYPTAPALEAIRTLEPFDRGWYAGPVGWIGPDAAEFAVAIRSGLVEGARLALYSGAGIVRGSTPEAEWDEIEHKISDFINVLGLDLRRAK
ncbi:hypothetical protein AWN76_007295 [Rhodothermaceae bacterium RA]|nr:hypothetical protein AWN76_007295 [Rhodothermaceae bacterium RA]